MLFDCLTHLGFVSPSTAHHGSRCQRYQQIRLGGTVVSALCLNCPTPCCSHTFWLRTPQVRVEEKLAKLDGLVGDQREAALAALDKVATWGSTMNWMSNTTVCGFFRFTVTRSLFSPCAPAISYLSLCDPWPTRCMLSCCRLSRDPATR